MMNVNIRHHGLVVTFAVAALFAAQPAAAVPLNLSNGDKITLDRTGAYGGAFGGGEFRASGVSGSVLNGSGDSFFTFCVEYSEHIGLGVPYFVRINTQAVNGGAGVNGYGPTDPNGVLGSYDPLSKGTSWLYTQFRNNTLNTAHGVGYDFAQNNARVNSLQLAIWSLENELQGSALTAFNNDLVAQNWAGVAKTQSASWSDTGRVRIMNLYTSYNATTGVFSGNSQDQLYMTPVPEPETYAMMLAGLGLLGITARRRRPYT